MPRQRFIHPDLWTDPALGKLAPMERLLFIGCFSNADDEGRLLGSPAYLRATIFPYDDLSLEEVRNMRDRMVEACKNVVLYQVDGLEYLAFLKWNKYQKPKYPKPSKLPPPPPPKNDADEVMTKPGDTDVGETFTQNRGNNEEVLEKDLLPRLGLGRDRDGFGMGLGRDGFGASTSADAELTQDQAPSGGNPNPPKTQETQEIDHPQLEDATVHERAILHELKQVQGFPGDYAKNLAFIRTLAVDFPDLDLLEQAKKWRVYKLDKPLAKKSNPRLQFRNWCEIAAKRRAKTETAIRASPATASKRIPRAFESLMEWAKEDDP